MIVSNTVSNTSQNSSDIENVNGHFGMDGKENEDHCLVNDQTQTAVSDASVQVPEEKVLLQQKETHPVLTGFDLLRVIVNCTNATFCSLEM